MIRASLLALFSTLMICGFCGKEFVSLGRHTWRCKNKVNFNGNVEENAVPAVEFRAQECLSPSSYKVVKCCCGKVCKGARGLKMHQRSCRVIDGMEEELQQHIQDVLNEQACEEEVESIVDTISSQKSEETFPDLKKEIKLPKSPSQWSIANDFFQLTLSNSPITAQDINKNINTMATVIYNYFSENYGFINATNNGNFESKYKSTPAKDLKKVLRKLKSENGNLLEIKFVAKKLRKLLRNGDIAQQHDDVNTSDKIDHNDLITKNFGAM